VNASNFYPVEARTSVEKSQQKRVGYGLLRCFANAKLPRFVGRSNEVPFAHPNLLFKLRHTSRSNELPALPECVCLQLEAGRQFRPPPQEHNKLGYELHWLATFSSIAEGKLYEACFWMD
jgi:hypothetical protein